MTEPSRFLAGVTVAICLALGPAPSAPAQTHASEAKPVQMKGATPLHASGTFDVVVKPAAPDDKAEGSTVGRMSLEKQFHGDLVGTSKGEMLTAATAVKNSAGYVAIERVSGTLNGRRGTFVLQHTGTMNRGALQLDISVVPDSGTDELAGLTGQMTIKITDGKHYYEFDYAIAAIP